jgi:hypothetical protein
MSETADIRQLVTDLGMTLNSLGCIEVRKAVPADKYVSFEAVTVNEAEWDVVLELFLLDAEGRGFRSHTCELHYLDKSGPEPRKVKCWYLRFSSRDMAQMWNRVSSSFRRARVLAHKAMGSKPQVRHEPDVRVPRPQDASKDRRHQEQKQREAVREDERVAAYDVGGGSTAPVQTAPGPLVAPNGSPLDGVSDGQVKTYRGRTRDGRPIELTEAPLPWGGIDVEQKDPDQRGALPHDGSPHPRLRD